jgi:hypothetical protein
MDVRQQPMNMQQMSVGQRVDMVANVLQYPALTILVFMRRRCGYRTLRPFQIVLMFLLMQLVPAIFSQHCTLVNGCSGGTGSSDAFFYFSWAFLIWAFVQRWLRWRDLTRGKAWHSYSRGISHFEFLARLPLPSFLPQIRPSFLYRVLDAGVVIGFAMLIGGIPALHGLAQWLFFAAFCMAFVENYVYDKQLDRELDLLDSVVEGQIHAELAQRYSGASVVRATAPSLSETAGIPTGIGPDIARQVEARQKTGHGIAPDKLATA